MSKNKDLHWVWDCGWWDLCLDDVVVLFMTPTVMSSKQYEVRVSENYARKIGLTFEQEARIDEFRFYAEDDDDAKRILMDEILPIWLLDDWISL